jgi:hypothetical protein
LKSIITGELPTGWADALPVSIHLYLQYCSWYVED